MLIENEIQSKFFDTEYLRSDLKGRSVRGGAVTMCAQGVTLFLNIGSTVVLARLLTPEDFGLIAMVTAITGFVAMFKDLGLSMATVQKAEINHAQVSTLFWINMLLSFLIMSATITLAPVIAWFYSEPHLTWITLALASAFIFSGLTVQHQALLRRQMRFSALATIEIVSMFVGIIIALTSAIYGLGYWALVLMHLSKAVTSAIGVWVACDWRPGLPVRRSGVRSMLTFGGHLTGFNFVNYFARNLDNILIGWYWGAGSLGLYSKAYSLLMLPLSQINTPISAVAIPALSRLQDEPERYKNYYLKAISLIAFITMPIVMFLIVMSKEIIQLVLGPQWNKSSQIFAVLGISALIQPILNTSGWLHVSIGRTDRMFKWGLIASFFIVLSFIIGLPYGTTGVAISYTISILILAVPCLWYAFLPTSIKLCAVIKSLGPIMLSTLSVGVALALLKYFDKIQSSGIVGLAIWIVIAILIYVSVTSAISRSLAFLFNIETYYISHVKMILKIICKPLIKVLKCVK